MGADEQDFIELLLASERVAEWLDAVRTERSTYRLRQILSEFSAAVLGSEAYAEEARVGGAVHLLTEMLKRCEDEEVMDLASDVIAACSGPMALSRKLSTFTYNGTSVVIQEGALGDGVGSKVWTVAHVMCRELAAHPDAVAGARVLELGAGTGVCGILAAKLGAAQVLLTDYTDGVLRNLRDCMLLNAPGSSSSTRSQQQQQQRGGQEEEEAQKQEPGEYHVQQAPGQCAGQSCSEAGEELPWESGVTAVRFLDWTDSLSKVESALGKAAPSLGRSIAAASHTSLDSLDRASNESRAPGVEPDERFDLLIGTDVLYEWPMVDTLAAAIAHRMAPGGRTLLYCAVREAAMFEAFKESTAQLGLRLGMQPVVPLAEDLDHVGVQTEYEGGYVLMALEHAAHPATNWHRDDLF